MLGTFFDYKSFQQLGFLPLLRGPVKDTLLRPAYDDSHRISFVRQSEVRRSTLQRSGSTATWSRLRTNARKPNKGNRGKVLPRG